MNSKPDRGSLHEEAKESDNRDERSEGSKTSGSEVASKTALRNQIRETDLTKQICHNSAVAKGRAKSF